MQQYTLGHLDTQRFIVSSILNKVDYLTDRIFSFVTSAYIFKLLIVFSLVVFLSLRIVAVLVPYGLYHDEGQESAEAYCNNLGNLAFGWN